MSPTTYTERSGHDTAHFRHLRHIRVSTHLSDAQEALAFAMKWRHWGGGDDEDIFVQFGLNTCQYFLRVRKLLSTPAAAALSPDEKAHLRQICFTRLHDGGLPTVESNPVAPHNS